jgi:hypothetical protein
MYIFSCAESTRLTPKPGKAMRRRRLFEAFQTTITARAGKGVDFLTSFGSNPLKNLDSEK